MRATLYLAVIAIAIAALSSSAHATGYGPETVTNWAGFIQVNTTRFLWYWAFESRHDPVNDPVVVWLSGGPGCSSSLALFGENGPYKINPSDLSLSLNPYSWNANATVIWIDSPTGTGFSYDSTGAGVTTEGEVAANLWEFMQNFFSQYPKYSKLPFFITGESYAGHYVPSFASYVTQQNLAGTGNKINLQGIAIGNGLVDPYTQYAQYAPFAHQHGLVSDAEYGLMMAGLPICQAGIAGCAQNSTLGWLACINAYTLCNVAEVTPVTLTGINPYDVRQNCTVQPLCYDFSEIDKFFAQPAIATALNTGGRTWQECNRVVDMELVFAGDWMVSVMSDIPFLLANKVQVLVYNGEDDFVCNWLGSQAWTKAMPWGGQSGFNAATNTTWVVDNANAGSFVSFEGLTFLRVASAGHMVPRDQPSAALEMLRSLTLGLPLNH